ncbi:MAG: hypothetical protein IT371_01240 [Deltaproteobacteria bacterium]|nr:hypothetical protein [Deltaproteobacteria bacterium]
MTPCRHLALAAILFAFLAAGCGGPRISHTVDEGKLKDMSRQGQLWIYDAENEIVVALDRMDEARDELAELKQKMKEAEKGVERAEKRGRGSAVEVAEGWLVYLEAMEKWAKANIALHELGVIVARGAVELAKAQVIQREDLLGGKDFAVVTFQEQYNELKAVYDKRTKAVTRLRKEARRKETRWWTLRRRFTAQTGDHDSGLWID